MNAVIEQAGVEDAQEILDLQELAYQSEAAIYGEYEIPPLIQTLNEIRDDFQNQVFLKAAIDGRLSGLCEGTSGKGSVTSDGSLSTRSFRTRASAPGC